MHTHMCCVWAATFWDMAYMTTQDFALTPRERKLMSLVRHVRILLITLL